LMVSLPPSSIAARRKVSSGAQQSVPALDECGGGSYTFKSTGTGVSPK
jgi:hypothetical protein